MLKGNSLTSSYILSFVPVQAAEPHTSKISEVLLGKNLKQIDQTDSIVNFKNSIETYWNTTYMINSEI